MELKDQLIFMVLHGKNMNINEITLMFNKLDDAKKADHLLDGLISQHRFTRNGVQITELCLDPKEQSLTIRWKRISTIASKKQQQLFKIGHILDGRVHKRGKQ